jgi:hypothetical protein
MLSIEYIKNVIHNFNKCLSLSTNYINKRIENEICYTTIKKLEDSNLMKEYIKSKSVKKNIKELSDILHNHFIDNNTINLIINDYLPKLIPPGTKGVIRGNMFNKIVKHKILAINLDPNKFLIEFEKKLELYSTDEIPDWYILDKTTKKFLIGYNQIDLWSGGHQLNRGFNYINKKNSLCVICNYIEIKKTNNKIYELFNIGFSNNSLCYINNLNNIIIKFFD